MPDHSITPAGQHVKAVWNGVTLAESDDTLMVEGNHYFPPHSIDRSHFEDSSETSECPWKGHASYYDVVAGGERNPAAAWFYKEPFDEATQIRDHVAFWRGVEVTAA